jgi:hypothetical protein
MPGFNRPRSGVFYLQTSCQPESDQIKKLEWKDLALTVELEKGRGDAEN